MVGGSGELFRGENFETFSVYVREVLRSESEIDEDKKSVDGKRLRLEILKYTEKEYFGIRR